MSNLSPEKANRKGKLRYISLHRISPTSIIQSRASLIDILTSEGQAIIIASRLLQKLHNFHLISIRRYPRVRLSIENEARVLYQCVRTMYAEPREIYQLFITDSPFHYT